MHPGYFPVFFWSLLILGSFWGYGEILRRRINRPEFSDIGWGLTCAWGMSVVLALGGVLMAFRIAKAANLTVLVLFGAAAAFYYAVQRIAGSGNPKSKIQNSKSGSTVASSGLHFQLFSVSAFPSPFRPRMKKSKNKRPACAEAGYAKCQKATIRGTGPIDDPIDARELLLGLTSQRGRFHVSSFRLQLFPISAFPWPSAAQQTDFRMSTWKN